MALLSGGSGGAAESGGAVVAESARVHRPCDLEGRKLVRRAVARGRMDMDPGKGIGMRGCRRGIGPRAAVGAARRLMVALLLVAVSAPALRAQEADSSKVPAPFFTVRDAWLAAGFTAGTLAMLPLDKKLAHNFRQPVNQANPTLHDAAAFFRFMGQPAPQIIGPTLYIAGRLGHWHHIAALGLHGTESMLLGTAITTTIKVLVGRARPFVTADTNSTSFAFGRGIHSTRYQSFPSGHATTAFAVASSVTSEVSHWVDQVHAWPGIKYVMGVTMYGGASMIALSRIYDDKHWASDVMAGAAIGTFAGTKVVRYDYDHPKNRIDRWLLSMRVVPTTTGVTYLAWTVPTGF